MRPRALLRAVLLAAVPSVVVLGAATEAAAQTAAPSEADVKQASDFFEKGSKLYDAKKFALALDEFKKSYATVASPNSHLYIARCLVGLKELRDAYLEFDKVIDEADAKASAGETKYAPTRDTARAERDELAPKLALVTPNIANADAATTLKIGGAAVPRERWGKPLPIAPGDADVVLETPGKPPVTQKLSLAAGDKKDLPLDAAPAAAITAPPPVETPPEQPAASHGSLRPFAYVAGGVGVAGLALFAVAGAMTSATYSDLESSCGGRCPPGGSYDDDISSGKTTQTLANVGLIVGAVGVAAGVTLFIISREPDKKSDAPPAPAARLVVGPSYAGLNGTF